MPTPPAGGELEVVHHLSEDQRRNISVWLLVSAGVLFLVAVSWSVSRLTELGLGIEEPKPFKVRFPTDEKQWKEEYDRFMVSPGIAKQQGKEGLTLEDFKFIYKAGWAHQQLSALVVASYFLPWAYFSYRGDIPRKLQPVLLTLLGLVGAQAVIVATLDGQAEERFRSGASAATAYRRYALQLLATTALYGGTAWLAMTVRGVPIAAPGKEVDAVRRLAGGLTAFAFVAAALGGYAAGPDAALVARQWPSLEGRLPPLREYLLLVPGYRQSFSGDDAARGYHRMAAALTLVLVAALSYRARGLPLPPPVNRALAAVQLAVALQAAGGLLAVFYGPKVPLLCVHQGGGLAVLTTLLWLSFTLRIQPLALL